MCNKAGGIAIIGCNARGGIALLSGRAHGNTCNKAGGVSIIGCNTARDGIAPLSMHAHGDMCNKAGSAGIIDCDARNGIAPLRARVHGVACNKAGGVGIIGCNTRDGIAPLKMHANGNVCNKAGGISIIGCNATGVGGCDGLPFCSSKNDSPNKVLPPNVGSPKKSVLKRKSLSRGNGGTVIRPLLSKQLPLALRRTSSIIMPNPPLQWRGVYDGFFGPAFTFAAKSLQHTTNQLQQWAREQDLGVKSFADSILSTS